MSWHDLRIGGAYGASADDRAAQQDAAQKTEAHASHADRRAFRRARPHLPHCRGQWSAYGRYPSRVALDTEGKPLVVFDAKVRRVMEYCLRLPLPAGGLQYIAGTDMAGNPLYQNGMDGGARRSLSNVAGKPIRTWDARGHAFTHAI